MIIKGGTYSRVLVRLGISTRPHDVSQQFLSQPPQRRLSQRLLFVFAQNNANRQGSAWHQSPQDRNRTPRRSDLYRNAM